MGSHEEIVDDVQEHPSAGDHAESQKYVFTAEDFRIGARDMVRLMVPVTFCIILVSSITSQLPFFKEAPSRDDEVFGYLSDEDADAGDQVVQAVIIAVVILVAIVAMTFLLLLLYKYKWTKCLTCFTFMGPLIILTLISTLLSHQILLAYDVPADYITVAFAMFNFSGVGLVQIFYVGPQLLLQSYLVVLSALMALIFIKLLPTWALFLVVIVVACWDLFAVLSKHGPLKKLVDTANERGEGLIPGVVYTAGLLFAERAGQNESYQQEDEDEGSSELGLGDFVFYSILVGKAATYGDWNTTLATFISILVGLCATLALQLSGKMTALPALPISIFCGVLFFATTLFISSPFSGALANQMIYI